MIIDITNDKVVLAYYGSGINIIDVLPVIENIIKYNVEKKFIVSNDTFKKDPIFGKRKQLVLKLESEKKMFELRNFLKKRIAKTRKQIKIIK